MFKYILRRLLQAIPLLFFISLVLFLLMQATGDPISAMGERNPMSEQAKAELSRALGLDQPAIVQYVYWLIGNDWVIVNERGEYGKRKGVLRGDFGISFMTRRPALTTVVERLPNTLLLMGTAQVVIVVVSLVVGIVGAVRQYSALDNLLTGLAFVMYSVPVFLMAYLLMYVFAYAFRQWGLPYLPTGGMFDPRVGQTFEQVARHMVLPVLTISLISIAGYSRFIRSAMLEVIHSDYIRTARSKGIHERRVLFVHGFRNAALPFVTLIGLDLPFLLAGAVVTESIFSWPGMGRLYIDHLQRSDFPVLMCILMMISLAVVIFQILTDIVYSLLDPRIRFD